MEQYVKLTLEEYNQLIKKEEALSIIEKDNGIYYYRRGSYSSSVDFVFVSKDEKWKEKILDELGLFDEALQYKKDRDKYLKEKNDLLKKIEQLKKDNKKTDNISQEYLSTWQKIKNIFK